MWSYETGKAKPRPNSASSIWSSSRMRASQSHANHSASSQDLPRWRTFSPCRRWIADNRSRWRSILVRPHRQTEQKEYQIFGRLLFFLTTGSNIFLPWLFYSPAYHHSPGSRPRLTLPSLVCWLGLVRRVRLAGLGNKEKETQSFWWLLKVVGSPTWMGIRFDGSVFVIGLLNLFRLWSHSCWWDTSPAWSYCGTCVTKQPMLVSWPASHFVPFRGSRTANS